jgi:2-polyprenyl-3-methyl-5-hydroxy-6-metoxy-1,4-benzoquinol methylase
VRCLEIGPNKARLPGFETLDAVKGPLVDHVADCRKTPFKAETFDLVYSSHVLEHVEWYDVESTVAEWARILKPGGTLEVHTVDAHRILKAWITLEETGEWTGPDPVWRSNMTRSDPYLFAVGRVLNWAKDGSIHQYHRALITPNYLRQCFERAGLVDLAPLTREDARGTRHSAFINLGLKGVKA